jgi:hypothetical protein
MLRSLEEFARNVASADERLPLLSRTIQGDPSRYDRPMSNPRYDQHCIKTVFMSPMFDTGQTPSGLDRVEDKLRANIWTPAGSDGYQQHCVGFGGPWDLSMVTFVGGVFLDNIDVVTGDSGYRSRYLRQKNTLEEGVIVRHTHGIDGKDTDLCDRGRGAYLVRRDLLNMNDVDDRNTLIASSEGELRRHLLENYVEVTDFESTVDLVGGGGSGAESDSAADTDADAGATADDGRPSSTSGEGTTDREPDHDTAHGHETDREPEPGSEPESEPEFEVDIEPDSEVDLGGGLQDDGKRDRGTEGEPDLDADGGTDDGYDDRS